jgi:hypothetical protein
MKGRAINPRPQILFLTLSKDSSVSDSEKHKEREDELPDKESH